MPDFDQDFPIKVPAGRVHQAVSTPGGLDCWWTKTSAGNPVARALCELGFGPEYDCRAKVTRCVSEQEFELHMTLAHADWLGTRVSFPLDNRDGATRVRFYHTVWPSLNEHDRVSCHCWALYLKILLRYLEHGELVPYQNRLDA
jgi:hypothetical protein